MSILYNWVIPGCVAVFVVALITLFSETTKIESDLTARAEAVLASKDMDWASISFEGRDGFLEGIAPEDGEADWAVELLDATWGVRAVRDDTELLAAQTPYTWGIERDGDKLSMIGYLPYKLTKSVPGKIEQRFPDGALSNSVTAARGAPVDIGNVVDFSTDFLQDLPAAKIMLIDDGLTISGNLEDGNEAHLALYNTLLAKIETADLGPISIEFQVNQPKPPAPLVTSEPATTQQEEQTGEQAAQVAPAPDGFTIKRTTQGVELRGTVPSEDVKKTILDLAGRKFGAAAVSDALTIEEGIKIAGLGYDDYRKMMAAALQSVSRLSDGEATLNSEGFTLNGGAFYDQALEQVQDVMRRVLPEGLAFSTGLSVAAPGETVDAEACQTLLQGELAQNTILFASGKAAISADSFGLLDGLIYITRRCPDSLIQIEGTYGQRRRPGGQPAIVLAARRCSDGIFDRGRRLGRTVAGHGIGGNPTGCLQRHSPRQGQKSPHRIYHC